MRTPIKVQRVPIKVERKAIKADELSWEQVYEKYIRLIKYASKSIYKTYQTENPEDLFQEGQLVLYDCWLKYKEKGESEFALLFKASLWRKLKGLSSRQTALTVDLDTVVEQGCEPRYEPDLDTSLEQTHNLKKLAELLKDKPLALTILKEFVSPGERTMWESKMDYSRREMLKGQNFNVFMPSSILPTRKSIRRGMEISQAKFDQALNELKAAMREVYVLRVE